MKTRELGRTGQQVSALGLGCMSMASDYAYGPSDEREAVATLHRALELGVTLWDTADVYGFGANEELLRQVLVPNRSRVFLATKFGFVADGQGGAMVDVRPERIAAACDASLQRLGIDTIDLYYAHRIDPAVPVEEMVGAMAALVQAGKVRFLGLSEASATSLRRAVATHPIAALQSEYSLFTRDVEAEILPACQKLGVSLVPFSPLGRGLLTNPGPQLAEKDLRRSMPRFGEEVGDANAPLVAGLHQLATEKGISTAQLALAWLLSQDEHLIPIPGTKRRKYLEENAAAVEVELSALDQQRLTELLAAHPIVGARYGEGALKLVNR
ncbi:aldo/keto reductase [Hymenobacter arizonensis]|uniref:Predicted oxidoreductase n=1 Tax=Hymenobacter arizonensis TaxID=1227077 RepID=A0A1I5ZZ54_HYMAR|nr:aldo/keto reductase [Hymenobacter arizonensis]SFQ61759.1 Predicted oxidoreductase [Hymenobacter arizonensis]